MPSGRKGEEAPAERESAIDAVPQEDCRRPCIARRAHRAVKHWIEGSRPEACEGSERGSPRQLRRSYSTTKQKKNVSLIGIPKPPLEEPPSETELFQANAANRCSFFNPSSSIALRSQPNRVKFNALACQTTDGITTGSFSKPAYFVVHNIIWRAMRTPTSFMKNTSPHPIMS